MSKLVGLWVRQSMVRCPDREKMARADWPIQWLLLKHQKASMRWRADIGKGTGPIEPDRA